jgi:hypothetical protein
MYNQKQFCGILILMAIKYFLRNIFSALRNNGAYGLAWGKE